MRIRKILCKIGIHKWNRPTFISHGFQSNVLDYKKTCTACGKTVKWVEAKR